MKEITETKQILLLDDDAAHRALERRAIAAAFPKLKIIEATSLGEARTLLSEHAATLCLAVVDFNLDGERGIDLIGPLRLVPELARLPVLVVSTSGMEFDMRASIEAGASSYLVKSSDPVKFQGDLAEEAAKLMRLE